MENNKSLLSLMTNIEKKLRPINGEMFYDARSDQIFMNVNGEMVQIERSTEMPDCESVFVETARPTVVVGGSGGSGYMSPFAAMSKPVVAVDSAPTERIQNGYLTDPAFLALVAEKKKALNLTDGQCIMAFGTEAQKAITEVSDRMLEGVKNKDLGSAGEALNDMMSKIRGFDISDLEKGKKVGFFGRLMGKMDPVVKFAQQYESVQGQIMTIQDNLTTHRTKMMKDIVWLDRLYGTTLEYFHNLAVYIQAAREKLDEIENTHLPNLKNTAETSNDMIAVQNLREMTTIRDDLERKLHDLELTRQVVMQNLPSIRLYQENDKMLVGKIQSMLLNTLPLWKNQLAQAITLYRSQEALRSLKSGNDLNNELLVRNARNLREGNVAIRKEVERGIFDIGKIKEANESLILTLQESIEIAQKGREHRKEAERVLANCEQTLKDKLLSYIS